MTTLILCLVSGFIGFALAYCLENYVSRFVIKDERDTVAKLRAELLAKETDAVERETAEYERGMRDGWGFGLKEGIEAARKVRTNQRVLTELAARRFTVGGLRAHE